MLSLASNPPTPATINDAIGLLAALADKKAVKEALDQLRDLTVEKVEALEETRKLAVDAANDRKYVEDTKAEIEAGREQLAADRKALSKLGEEQTKHYAARDEAASQREKALAEAQSLYDKELKINQDALNQREVAVTAREEWVEQEKERLAQLATELEGKTKALREIVA